MACCGLIWLAHRFSLLLSLPIETSVKSLSIPVPNIPLISVDKVTDTSLVFHWDYDSKTDSKDESGNTKDTKDLNTSDPSGSSIISHYVLYINGIETLTINGQQHKCTLDDLQPGTNYQIDLVAFNMANFRSRSSPIYVKTSAKPIKESNMQSLENPDNVMKCLLREQERASMTKNDSFKASITNGRSRSGTLDGHQNPHHNNNNNPNQQTSSNNNTKAKHPHLIDDINELKWLLESGLEEVQSLMKSYKEAEMEFEEEEINLMAARNEAKERRKYEDNNRTNLRQEIKLLEEQRVKSTSRISADEKKIKERMKKIDNYNNQIEKWQEEIKIMKKKKDYFDKEHPDILKKLKQDIITLNQQIFSLQTEVHETEDDLRDEISKRKSLENQKVKVIGLFEEINKNINEVTGLLSKDGMVSLNELIELKPEWKDELFKEIVEIDEKAEADWKFLQQKEWMNFNSMKNEIDEKNKIAMIKSNSATAVTNPMSNDSTTSLSAITSALGVDNNATTTATNTTNVNGYVYSSIPSSSNASMNGFNNQGSFNTSTMRNLMRPRINTSGSFYGPDSLPEKPISQTDSTTSTHNSNNNSNMWPLNLSIDSNNANMVNKGNDSMDSPTVDMLLPQHLIDSEEFGHLFDSKAKTQPNTAGSIISQPISQKIQPPLPPTTASTQPGTGSNAVSPNISQLNTFDAYQNNNINGFVLNSTPQHNRVTSLGALATATSQNSIMNGSTQAINMIGSPNSLNAYLSNDNGLSSNMLDLSQAATTSPFNSNTPMNLSLNGSSTVNNGAEIHQPNVLFSQNPIILGDSSSQYSKIFGSLNNGNNGDSSKNNLDFGLSRGRSTSFGSSIWSNGNNGNANSGNRTWGSSKGNSAGFSFLGAPIAMTSTNQSVPSATNDINNPSILNNDEVARAENLLFKNLDSLSPAGFQSTHNLEGQTQGGNGSSFLKSVIGKFGSSPTKTVSNKTIELDANQNDAIEEYDMVDDSMGKHKRTTSNSGLSHHKNGSVGSSRFFKLSRKNSIVSNSQHSVMTNNSLYVNANPQVANIINSNVAISSEDEVQSNGSSGNTASNSGGFMGRKLSFAFKRDREKDKEKE